MARPGEPRAALARPALACTALARTGAPDFRRCLELALAGLWLLDALLQFQAVMFTTDFARMIGAAAAGNPAFISRPDGLDRAPDRRATAAGQRRVATLQLLIGLGIAWRPARRVALAASVAWALGVWWLGEGLGGLLSGATSPVAGLPGPALLYAVVAVLLWPPRPGTDAAFPAAGRVGAPAARAAWIVVWGALAASTEVWPGPLGRDVSAAAAGQPGWLTGTDQRLARLLLDGRSATIALAVVLALVAAGVCWPAAVARVAVLLAIAAGTALWLAQGLGGILAGGATDPGSGPLLVLLALCYWPRRAGPEPGGPGRSGAAWSGGGRGWVASLTGQAWVGYPLAGVMVATAVYCLARIVISVRGGRPADRLLDATHVLMALTMAGMLAPWFALPWPAALRAVFGAGAALFGWRAIRSQHMHPLQHALLCAAMVYMLGSQQVSAAGDGRAGRGRARPGARPARRGGLVGRPADRAAVGGRGGGRRRHRGAAVAAARRGLRRRHGRNDGLHADRHPLTAPGGGVSVTIGCLLFGIR